MDQQTVLAGLADLGLEVVRYFDSLGSTNDEAARWAEAGAPDWALVVADEQTAGRGRAGRSWLTPAGTALAFSLVMRPKEEELPALSRLTALGALSVTQALRQQYQLPALIKWPNDVLIGGLKVGGVLAEAHWSGSQLATLVIGIGINIAPGSISPQMLPPASLNFPAGCIETALGAPVDRLELLHAILAQLLGWRKRLSSPAFWQTWEDWLAFRNEWVQVLPGEYQRKEGFMQEGLVLGLAPDGGLRLRTRAGELVTVRVGEVRLKPGDASKA
jgi:BirA family biotin operon repressor/biotin-[acetyl-CoA-carboxylase] ligase